MKADGLFGSIFFRYQRGVQAMLRQRMSRMLSGGTRMSAVAAGF
jgi:hypothetical protein